MEREGEWAFLQYNVLPIEMLKVPAVYNILILIKKRYLVSSYLGEKYNLMIID